MNLIINNVKMQLINASEVTNKGKELQFSQITTFCVQCSAFSVPCSWFLVLGSWLLVLGYLLFALILTITK